MKTKIIIGFVTCIVLLLAVLIALEYADTNQKSIKIGFIGPLSGDAAAYGESDRSGMNVAVKEINTNGGIARKPIEAIYEDGKCDSATALSAVQKLIDVDHVSYIVGGGCTSETLAIVPLITSHHVLLISPSASAGSLSGVSPYFLRNYPNDNLSGTALAGYVHAHYHTAAVIAEKTDYALGLKNSFVAEAQKDGTRIAATEDYPSSTFDFRALLLHIKAANPDVIFIDPQSGAGAARIAQQARQLGIQAAFVDANYTGADVLAGGGAVNGLVAAVTPGLSSEGRGTQFLVSYQNTYGKEPEYSFPAAAAYDDVYLIKQGIESVGNDPVRVAQYLHQLSGFTGALGTYHFDNKGDVQGITPIFQQIVGGKLVNLTS